MLAAREVVQESTGFSRSELVFAHNVSGPLAVLQDDLKAEEPPVNLIMKMGFTVGCIWR